MSSSLDRMLDLLDLFTEDRPVWTVEQMIRATAFSRSTIYRYVRSLTRSGLLGPVSGGAYALGPAFVERDRMIQRSDPILTIASTVADQLGQSTGETALIAQTYRNRVLCVWRSHGGEEDYKLSRGLALPLFAGAASKVLVAHLPLRRLKKLVDDDRPALAVGKWPADWAELRRVMRVVRRSQALVCRDEPWPGRITIAAPIFDSEGTAVAAIGLWFSEDRPAAQRLIELEAQVAEAARTVTVTLSLTSPAAARPPRGQEDAVDEDEPAPRRRRRAAGG
ncbi:IclR family transcriptional regulator [Zavarzinia sp. CC-PAN008]|uniref:IclR family transcriptional regulator n=1 Tax=Zavarzinia sp. CC-PAN008 TaxID=3243332 RepID=UPI003F745175